MTFRTHTIAAAAFSLIGLIGSASAQPVSPADVFRGALPADLQSQLRLAPSSNKVAACPAGFRAVFENQRMGCERRIQQVSNIKCPANFPNFTARNVTVGSDRDLCAKAGVNISSDGALTNFRSGVDFVFVPGDGELNGVSFVAVDSTVAPADGWRLEITNANGITDRYRRTLTVRTSPILVNP